MPITYDITKDSLYLEGMEKGLEEGLERGLNEGLEKSKQQMILRMLQQGILTIEQIAELAEVDVEFVLSLRENPPTA